MLIRGCEEDEQVGDIPRTGAVDAHEYHASTMKRLTVELACCCISVNERRT